jgi:hypothetical protein
MLRAAVGARAAVTVLVQPQGAFGVPLRRQWPVDHLHCLKPGEGPPEVAGVGCLLGEAAALGDGTPVASTPDV